MAATTHQRVIAQIADLSGVHTDNIKAEQHLVADLAMESLDKVEMVMVLEDEFGIEIPDEEPEKWNTVQDVLTYVTGRVGA